MIRRRYLSFILASCLFSSVSFASNRIITLNLKKKPLQTVLVELEKQSKLSFVYNTNDINLKKLVTVQVSKAPIKRVLNIILQRTSITYKIVGDHIILSVDKPRQNTTFNLKDSKNSDNTITGIIKDTAGEPAIGASVTIDGSKQGVVTDLNGRFSIKANPGDRLKVSYIGYKTQIISLHNQKQFNITLAEDSKMLDEVVSIGYGSTSVKKLVASVTAVDVKKLQGLTDANLTATLQGRASGVIVQNQGGEPGNVPSISIRGGGEPMYVIDGIISSSWDFQTLNPNDIASMSILKDAASLAVYGTRAANGVILVTTKEGNRGKTSIVYSFSAQFSQPLSLPDRLESYTYASVLNQAAEADGLGKFHSYSQEEMETIKNQTDPYHYPNTNWYKLGLKSVAPEYRHSLSITGNKKDLNYYVSLGTFEQGSIYTSDALNYTRYNLRSNVNTTFEKIGLKVAFNINGSLEKKRFPSFSANSIWDHLNAKSPLDVPFNPDGTLSSITDHPLMEMSKESGYSKNDGMFFNTQFIADWAVPKVTGLSFGTMLNYRLNASHAKSFSARAPQYNADGTQVEVAKPTLNEEGYFGEGYNFEVNAAYQRTFAQKHSIDAKFVFTAAENEGSYFTAFRKDFLSTAVDQLFAGSNIGMTNSGNGEEGGRMGLVGRLKYDYAKRYYIEGSFRYDGSDNFAPGHRWGFFPSGAVAWDITEEPFFKKLKLKNINMLKLRASYGQMGSESGVNRFGYLSTYNLVEKVIVIGGELMSGFSEGALVAPEQLTWYTTNSLDYGIDFSLFNYRLKGSADYFFYVTKGGLISPANRYTTPLGTSLPQIKADNEYRREGFEFNLRWSDKIANKVQYEIGTNMTYYNSLTAKDESESLSSLKNPYQRGLHQTAYYGLLLQDGGLYQSISQVLGVPRRPASTETHLGDIVYKDLNGDGKVDGEDVRRTGMPSSPHFTYGINFLFSYQGATISGLFYGTGKRNMMLGSNIMKAEAQHVKNTYQLDYWREDNPDASLPRVSLAAGVNGENNRLSSTFYLKNATFFRLKNLSVSYDFKYKLLKKCDWLEACQLSLTGSNLFTLSGVTDYFDPETVSTNGGYPVSRVYSVSLTLGF